MGILPGWEAPERMPGLSTTEYKLLAFFLSHPEQVLTREVLMERVWRGSIVGESSILSDEPSVGL